MTEEEYLKEAERLRRCREHADRALQELFGVECIIANSFGG